MDLYFAGTEQTSWTKLLYENGVRHMSLSFMGLRRRIKRLDRWRIADKYPDDVRVYLDSGAFTLNKPGSDVTEQIAAELREAYFQFVSDNVDRIEFASEFDANVLGHQAVHSSRDSFWSTLPERKWMPIWHAEYGQSNLLALADTFGRVGVLQGDAGGDLTPILNRMASLTRLHGISMTQMDMMRDVGWTSVGSTSWLSPSQYGDTIIWTGRELKRYPRDMQETGRKRHRTWLAENEFDTEAVEAGDSKELLRVSIWSWLKYVESLGEVAIPGEDDFPENAEPTRPAVDIPYPSTWNAGAPNPSARIERPRERTLLPVVGIDFQTISEIGDDGQPTERQEPRMTTPPTTLLQCNTCFMANKCPVRQPDADCAYEIPVQIRTPAQLEAVEAALLEMQTQRVLLMRMIEQREGGYADPNLTAEIKLLRQMIKDRADGGNSFKLTVEGRGPSASAGMISRVFGERAGARLNELEAPRDTQTVIAEVLDAEVVSEDG